MGMGYQDLSPQQKAAYEADLARIGLTVKDVDQAPIVTSGGGHRVGGQNESSGGTQNRLIVNQIADLKKIVGVPDADYQNGARSDQGFDYPPPLPADRGQLHTQCANLCELNEKLSSDEHKNIVKAGEQFLLGNSAKVASYEPILNATRFPTEMAVSAAGSITVTAGNPLVFQGTAPIAAVYTSITIEPGGQIIVEAPTTLCTQSFTVLPG